MKPTFELFRQDDSMGARCGRVITEHNAFDTPVFMPVGTAGAVKGVLPIQLKEMGCHVILGNTFHLYLRPGHELVNRMGGLREFMSWNGSILTDSGGFQVFSLSAMNRITDEGVEFRSPLDGSRHFFTPERVATIQEHLGSSIAMVFDECVTWQADPAYLRSSVLRTTNWAKRFYAAHKLQEQRVFGIVQGGMDLGLRKESVDQITSIPFDGFAIGGLSVGEPAELTRRVLEATAPLLPKDKPRYLMGVGSPELIFEGVAQGIDMFDCVLPTRSGRHGTVFTRSGKINIKAARYKESQEPIDPFCMCSVCQTFTKGYIRHLFAAGEITAMVLATIHNLWFLLQLMRDIRQAIMEGSFAEMRKAFFDQYEMIPVSE